MRSPDMRIAIALTCLGLLTQCQPVTFPPTPHHAAPIPAPATASTLTPSPTTTPVAAPQYLRTSIAGITYQGVSFDARTHRLHVVDQARGPGSQFDKAQNAAQSIKGIAAINGGFFTPEGKPLGLVISNGTQAGHWNAASSLGSGVWHAPADGLPDITRREKLGLQKARTMQELLQSGPMLVEHSQPVAGLNASNRRDRSFLLWDGGHRWWFGLASPCSLAELANNLAKHSPTTWTVKTALNLDGGSSCDLWVSGKVSGGPSSNSAPWNRKVRNFLVLTPK